MRKQQAVLPFVMGGLAFVGFLLAAAIMTTAVQPLWEETMVLLLPAAVLCAVGFSVRKGILSPRTATVLTVVLSAVFLLLSLGYLFFHETNDCKPLFLKYMHCLDGLSSWR